MSTDQLCNLEKNLIRYGGIHLKYKQNLTNQTNARNPSSHSTFILMTLTSTKVTIRILPWWTKVLIGLIILTHVTVDAQTGMSSYVTETTADTLITTETDTNTSITIDTTTTTSITTTSITTTSITTTSSTTDSTTSSTTDSTTSSATDSTTSSTTDSTTSITTATITSASTTSVTITTKTTSSSTTRTSTTKTTSSSTTRTSTTKTTSSSTTRTSTTKTTSSSTTKTTSSSTTRTSTTTSSTTRTSTTTSVISSYCLPNTAANNSDNTTNSFILVGESNTRINDSSTNCSTNCYFNRTSQSVTLFTNTTYTALVSNQLASSIQLSIWIDFNDNYVFETYERVTLGVSTETTNAQYTLTIPVIGSNITAVLHRMRVMVSYLMPPTPCQTDGSRSETRDYMVKIEEYKPGSFTFSNNYVSSVSATTSCTEWKNFTSSLPIRSYTILKLNGSLSATGVSLTTPNIISSIVLALRTSTSYGPITANDRSWAVGLCGGGYELSANGAVCSCTALGYTVRPCIDSADWGGINSPSCSPINQRMSVTLYY